MGSNKNPGSEYKKLIEQIKEPFKSTTQTIGKINEIQSLNRSISDFTKPAKTIKEMSNNLLSQDYTPENSFNPCNEDDCEMLNICNAIGDTYKMCHKGSWGKRCTPEGKKIIQQQNNILASQTKQIKNQTKNNKRNFWLSIISSVTATLIVNAIILLLKLVL